MNVTTMNWTSWYGNGSLTVSVTSVTLMAITSVSMTIVNIEILLINMVVSRSKTGSFADNML